MKRPSFQFYPADWRNNAKLRRCSEAARGAWMDILCVLHDSDEYGVLRWPLADIARAAGVNLKLARELVQKDVLKGGDSVCEPYIYTPRSGRVLGDPVVLVQAEDGEPCWYCSRFVRDEYVRQRRGNASQFSDENPPPKKALKGASKASPKGGIGEWQGDGSTSSSTSTLKPSEQTHIEENSTGVEPSLAASVCLALKSHGITDINPAHPMLLELLKAGATLDQFNFAAGTAKVKKFNYVVGMVKGQREQAAAEAAGLAKGKLKVVDTAWRKDDNAIVRKAQELKIGTQGKTRDQLLSAIDAKQEQIDREAARGEKAA